MVDCLINRPRYAAKNLLTLQEWKVTSCQKEHTLVWDSVTAFWVRLIVWIQLISQIHLIFTTPFNWMSFLVTKLFMCFTHGLPVINYFTHIILCHTNWKYLICFFCQPHTQFLHYLLVQFEWTETNIPYLPYL